VRGGTVSPWIIQAIPWDMHSLKGDRFTVIKSCVSWALAQSFGCNGKPFCVDRKASGSLSDSQSRIDILNFP
jgi:hypothetical protein